MSTSLKMSREARVKKFKQMDDEMRRRTKARYNKVIPVYGDMMTVKEFKIAVELRCFTDEDGSAHPARNNKMSIRYVRPSHPRDIPKDATHIIWFNK